MAGRVAFGNVGGRDLAQLRDSLRQVPTIQQQLVGSNKETLQQLGAELDTCSDVEALLAKAITDNPLLPLKKGMLSVTAIMNA